MILPKHEPVHSLNTSFPASRSCRVPGQAPGQPCGRPRLRAGRVLLLVATLLALALAARPALAQHQAMRLYDEDSGLFNGSISALAQDRTGFLFVGTENGLYRYDGQHFSHLTDGVPANGVVEALRTTSDGRIWAVFSDRVYLLGAGQALSVAVEPEPEFGYGHRVAVLGDDLLLVRGRRLLRIRARSGTGPAILSVQPFLSEAAVARDPNRAALLSGFDTVSVARGEVWAGCGREICRLDGNGIAAVVGASSGLPADRWSAALYDHTGTLWLRSRQRIAFLPPGSTRFNVTDFGDGPGTYSHDTTQLDLLLDPAGRVMTQGAHGLLIRRGGAWVLQDLERGATFSSISAMLVDREGSLWLGSYGQGLGCLLGLGVFDNWTNLADDLVWNTRRDGAGTMWVASDLGVDALPASGAAGAAAPGWHTRGRAVTLAASADGQLWVGGWDGRLIRRDPRTGRDDTVAQLGRIYTIVQDPGVQDPGVQNPGVRGSGMGDPNAALWVGTHDGLVRIDRPGDAMPAVAAVPEVKDSVFGVSFDRNGELWALTKTTLLHRDRSLHWHAVMHTDPTGGYRTRSMAFAADGTLWLSSYADGIIRLHLDGDRIVSRDTQPGAHLASRDVEMVYADQAGRIWIGTDRGLDVTDGTSWRHLDTQDGLVTNDLDTNAASTDNDGTLWFGTSGGLSHLLDGSGLFRPYGLHPLITAVRLDNPASIAVPAPSVSTHLRWTGDPLVISFAALDFRYEKSIRFRYRLRGIDQSWTETAGREARYTNPPFGRLRFELVAVEPAHGLRSAPIELVIKMQPPLWKTWPVYAVVATATGSLLLALWRMRERYMLARQRLLEARVAERTREIEQARLILLRQATYDSLTGLLNRAAIMERLRIAMQEANRSGLPLAVALMDLDHFKQINDTHGHLGGDAVLAAVGRRLQAGTRGQDEVGRYGGEEIILLLPGLGPEAHARVETLRRTLFAEPVAFENGTIRISGSVGVTWMHPEDDASALVRRADMALYAAKQAGRNRTVSDPPAAWRPPEWMEAVGMG